MMMMHSNNREEIEEAFAGDIVALAGMKDTQQAILFVMVISQLF